jgi:hypothetical protein
VVGKNHARLVHCLGKALSLFRQCWFVHIGQAFAVDRETRVITAASRWVEQGTDKTRSFVHPFGFYVRIKQAFGGLANNLFNAVCLYRALSQQTTYFIHQAVERALTAQPVEQILIQGIDDLP